MTKRIIQLAGAVALSLAVAAPAFADIKINDNFSVGGYAVGEANINQSKPIDGSSSTASKLDGDAYKLWSSITFAPVTGTISLYAGQAGDPVILDAYATYDAGGGVKVTFGKFLSWMGYEAFDPINMTQVTYGWSTPQGFSVGNIPGYHTGVKVEQGNDTYTVGVAVLDSVDPSPSAKTGADKGDGDLRNGPGFEAYYTYKGVKNLTLFGGLTYEHNTGVNGAISHDYGTDRDATAIDLWAQYVVGDTTYAAEYSYRVDDYKANFADEIAGHKINSTFCLAEVQQVLDKQWAIMGRIGWIGKDYKTSGALKPSATTFTVAPTLTLTANLSVVFEYSYTHYKDADNENGLKSGNFVAAQVRFKF
jgi:hypothetical protein